MRDNKLSSNSSSASLDWKRRHGRATFEAFCAAAELLLVRGTIEPPEPPAADLIVELQGSGRVAFELVRLNDPDHLARFRLMQQMPRFLDRAFAALPPAPHAALADKYSEAHITLDFHGAASLGLRRKALAFIWDILEATPAGHRGKIDLHGK
jgi:hypothetical protein